MKADKENCFLLRLFVCRRARLRCSSSTTIEVRKTGLFWRHFCTKTKSFYHDRLGKNMGKALPKRRDAFLAGPQDVSVAWSDLPKGILGDHCPPAGCAVRDIFTQKDLAPSATVRKIQNDLFVVQFSCC
jgi:hypothetical protein